MVGAALRAAPGARGPLPRARRRRRRRRAARCCAPGAPGRRALLAAAGGAQLGLLPRGALADAPLAAGGGAAERLWDFPVALRVESVRGCLPERWASDFRGAMHSTARLKVARTHKTLRAAYESLRASEAEGRSGGARTRGPPPSDLVALGDGYAARARAEGLIAPLPTRGAPSTAAGRAVAASATWSRICRATAAPAGAPPTDTTDTALYAWPYRFGCALLAYRKDRVPRMGLPGGRPPREFADLLAPALRGRVAMPSANRELVAYALCAAGRRAGDVELPPEQLAHALAELRRAALCFDSTRYLSALKAGDAWVAVGWSSDIVPAVSRAPSLAMAAPEAGGPLWADVLVCPAAAGASASPLLPQYLDFVVQPARAGDLRGGSGGASPLLLPDCAPSGASMGVKPPVWLPSSAALARSDFLLPLDARAEEAYGTAIRASVII